MRIGTYAVMGIIPSLHSLLTLSQRYAPALDDVPFVLEAATISAAQFPEALATTEYLCASSSDDDTIVD